MSLMDDIEKKFVETVTLIVLTAQFDDKIENSDRYSRGWLDGYSRAWSQLTGKSYYELVYQVNLALTGTGKSLTN